MSNAPKINNEQGQAMAEFAFVLPILVALLFGIIQFGILYNNYVTLTDAARAGARTAVVSRGESDPAATCANKVRSAADNLNQTSLAVTCTSTWQPGDDVQVEADYPYDINLFGLVVKSGTLKTVMKERVE